MMNIDVILRHQDIIPEQLAGKNVVIIDVLRATSVIVTALANGAKSVETVASIDEAFAIKNARPNVMLAGERMAVKIEGFDFGNSPLEMTQNAVKGKELLLCTSNGTQAVAASKQAKSIWTLAFNNMEAVENELLRLQEDLIIICSGTQGKFSLDDALAAGIFINRLKQKISLQLSDSAIAVSLAIEDEEKLSISLKNCFHLNWLLQKGMKNDVDYCLQLDLINAVPKFNGQSFTL